MLSAPLGNHRINLRFNNHSIPRAFEIADPCTFQCESEGPPGRRSHQVSPQNYILRITFAVTIIRYRAIRHQQRSLIQERHEQLWPSIIVQMLGVFRFNFDAIIMSVAGRKADANLMRAWTISVARNIV